MTTTRKATLFGMATMLWAGAIILWDGLHTHFGIARIIGFSCCAFGLVLGILEIWGYRRSNRY